MKIKIYRNKQYGTYYYSKQWNSDDLTSFDDPINYQSTKTECTFIKEIDLDALLETAHNSDYTKPVLYQCPHDPACKCAMDEPCK